ncbi:uncharacterized transmembrane protein DDB_G0289901-like [Uranotaenia lowii]|uniref:uncharacterized transmembrane protein DDB_G0289901-like n=1 Tax=Uranotaenia lowii TaxID=190385 RepID=UPI00247A143D|nr:uncharacterized transmembrane protein DDB_G0289901-like [Uranotaenia lowii]
MLSYMLPVEEKSPSVTAASSGAVARNLSLNLNSSTGSNGGSPGHHNPGSSKPVGNGNRSSGGSSSRPGTVTVLKTFTTTSTTANGGGSAPTKVIKSAIKTNHRYQLVGDSSSDSTNSSRSLVGDGNGDCNGRKIGGNVGLGGKYGGKRNGTDAGVGSNGSATIGEDLSDERTSLLGNSGARVNGVVVSCSSVASTVCTKNVVKSDRNFNNLILVNGNGNVSTGVKQLASVLKKTSTGVSANGINGGAEGYSAVNSCEDDADESFDADHDDEDEEEEFNGEDFDLVAANNRKNQSQTKMMSNSASESRNLNGINGNQQQQQQQSVETPSSGIIVDTSDADSEQTAVSGGGGDTGSTGGGGARKVKMNKLGGSKNVTLKRVSFGSSKGSMVETLVFETPTPLPEHAERQFFHSPAVLAGAGTTVVTSSGTVPSSYHHPHHHYHHMSHYHHPMHQQQQQPLLHPQHPVPGSSTTATTDGGSLSGLDDSGIELQEEVERSKVRVSFFQSSKPQSISPPESLLFAGGQHNLIHFGPGSGGGPPGYDNNNTLLDASFITSAALNQQYDSLLAGHPHHPQYQHLVGYDPDDPASMAVAYDRQMR